MGLQSFTIVFQLHPLTGGTLLKKQFLILWLFLDVVLHSLFEHVPRDQWVDSHCHWGALWVEMKLDLNLIRHPAAVRLQTLKEDANYMSSLMADGKKVHIVDDRDDRNKGGGMFG